MFLWHVFDKPNFETLYLSETFDPAAFSQILPEDSKLFFQTFRLCREKTVQVKHLPENLSSQDFSTMPQSVIKLSER